MNIQLSRRSRVIAGVLLLALVTVEAGGLYLVRIVSGTEQVTDFQLGFSRAGHAHAGVLLILSLVALLYADAIGEPAHFHDRGNHSDDSSQKVP